MKKLTRLLVALMLLVSIGLFGCSGEQDERDRERDTGTDITTTTPDGGTDTNDGLGTDDGTGGTRDGGDGGSGY